MARQASSMTITAAVDDKASKPLDEIKGKGKDLTDTLLSLDAATNLASKAWSIASGIGSSLIGVLSDVTGAAMVAAKAERDLSVAVRLRGGAIDEVLPRMKAFASEIQRATGIGDDSTLQLMAQLSALGVLPSQLEAATVATIGWAKATNKDMNAAATDVIKALNGKFTALQRLGIQVNSSEEAIRKMAEGFAFAEEEGSSLEGRLKLLSEDWGDLKEIIGSNIEQSNVAKGTISLLSASVLQLQQVFASPAGRQAIEGFFLLLAEGSASAVGSLASFVPKIEEFWLAGGGPLKRLKRSLIDDIMTWTTGDEAKKRQEEELRNIRENSPYRALVEQTQKNLEELRTKLKSLASGGTIEMPKLEMPDLDNVGGGTGGEKEAAKRRKQIEKDDEASESRRQKIFDAGISYRLEQVGLLYDFEKQQAELNLAREGLYQELLTAETEDRAMAVHAKLKELDEHEFKLQLESLRRTEEFESNKKRIKLERAEETAKQEKEIADVRDKRRKEQLEAEVAMLTSAGNAVVSEARSAFSQVGKIVDGEMVKTDKAFGNWLNGIVSRLTDFFASAVVTGLLKLLGGALAGGPLGAVATFLGFSKGGDVKKFAGGGDVSGGSGVRDDVAALLTDGEHVIDVGGVNAVKNGQTTTRMIGGTQATIAPASVGATDAPVMVQGGSSIALSMQVGMLEPMDRSALERMMERWLGPALMRAIERGEIDLEALKLRLGLV